MARAHARRKTGRQHVSKAHAGQAHSAPRKRRRQRCNAIAFGNYAQTRQNKVECAIIVRGFDSWGDIFRDKTVNPRKGFEDFFLKWHGTLTPPALEYYRLNSDMNRVSFERTIVSKLLSRGFELEALEIEFDEDNEDRSGWGQCIWYKHHPSYAEPLGVMFRGLDPSFLNAMFKTQHAGDQKFGLYSLQMFGAALMGERVEVLLHKTTVFRKVVLSPPKQKMAAAA